MIVGGLEVTEPANLLPVLMQINTLVVGELSAGSYRPGHPLRS